MDTISASTSVLVPTSHPIVGMALAKITATWALLVSGVGTVGAVVVTTLTLVGTYVGVKYLWTKAKSIWSNRTWFRSSEKKSE